MAAGCFVSSAAFGKRPNEFSCLNTSAVCEDCFFGRVLTGTGHIRVTESRRGVNNFWLIELDRIKQCKP